MSTDIMISYRVAETGRPTEKHKHADGFSHLLASHLRALGYTVFLDVNALEVGL